MSMQVCCFWPRPVQVLQIALHWLIYFLTEPHIGHMYTAVIADSSARFHRLIGNSVTFSTGTDEHGLKIQQAALHANEEPGRFCDHVSGLFKTALKNCEISYTDYIRTTESRHKENVHSFWVNFSKITMFSILKYSWCYRKSFQKKVTSIKESMKVGIAQQMKHL